MNTDFKPTKEQISLHGLGFIQIVLPKHRLHIWHPDLPRRSCFLASNIHDHRFGFKSQIIVGEQHNSVYSALPIDILTADATHMSYLHEGARSAHGGRPWITDGYLSVKLMYEQKILPGESYTMEAYRYHSTEPGGDGRVATLMVKTDEGRRGAHSLCKIGIRPDDAFDRFQWDETRLWAIAVNVLSLNTIGFDFTHE